MADRYIDQAYVIDHWGSDLQTAIENVTGIDLTVHIERATAKVQSALRNSGYTPASTTDPTTVEEVIKEAVLGCLINNLSMIPEVSLPVPDLWNDEETQGPGWLVTGIRLGVVKLAANPSVAGAVGGFQSTEADPDVTTNSKPQNTSRTELDNW